MISKWIPTYKLCYSQDIWHNIEIFLQTFTVFITMNLVYYVVHKLISITIYHFMVPNIDKESWTGGRGKKNNEKNDSLENIITNFQWILMWWESGD